LLSSFKKKGQISLLNAQMSDLRNLACRQSFWLVVISAAVISGCTTTDGPLNITLHNPKTGIQRTCGAKESSAADLSVLATAVETCAKQLEARGFVRSDSR
jgi:hypothetical protein